MMSITECSLPIHQAVRTWADSAGEATAPLPYYIEHDIVALVAERMAKQAAGEVQDLPPLPTQLDILRAIGAAVQRCREDHMGEDAPMPRGLEIAIAPFGDVELLWRTDHHLISLFFGPNDTNSLRPKCNEEAVVTVECRHEANGKCPRVTGRPAVV